VNMFVAMAPITKIGKNNEWKFNVFSKTVPKLKKFTDNTLNMHEWFGQNWESLHSKLGYVLPNSVHHSLKL